MFHACFAFISQIKWSSIYIYRKVLFFPSKNLFTFLFFIQKKKKYLQKMYSKSPKIFNFLLLSFLLYFIQISLCEVESNDKRFSPSSHNNIEKRALSAGVVFQYTCKLTNNWWIFFFFFLSSFPYFSVL